MSKFTVSSLLLMRATLLSTSALAVLAIAPAHAKVGVTSATDGDPLGKPPSANERVLRIGIDVQANELITTRSNDRAHLMFLDGTSLTVGPNAQLTIDKFVYDPNSKTGDLAINASKGVFRLVGGRISKTNPITITTPSSTIGIRGGIALVEADSSRTISTFVFGSTMMVSGAGRTETVTRPGSQVTTNLGAMPARAVLVSSGALNGPLSQLEGRGSGGGGGGRAAAPTAVPTVQVNQKIQSSGFIQQNSGQGTSPSGPRTLPTLGRGPDNLVDRTATALSNANTQAQSQQAVQQQAAVASPSPSTPAPPVVTPPPVVVVPPPPPPPPPQVIVTYGRFRADPAYTGFNSATLGVTPTPGNNSLLAPAGSVSASNATITLADGRSFTVPWQPGAGLFAVSITHPTFGDLTGTGLVGPNGEYFAYSFKDTSNKTIGFIGGTPTTMAQFPTSGFAQHTLVNVSATGTGLAFAGPTVAGDPALRAAATQSPLYSAYAAGNGPNVGETTSSAISSNSMQSTISIAGQGASQKSYMGVFIGEYFRDYNDNTIFNAGTYRGTYRLGGNDKIGRSLATTSTFDTGGGNSVFGPEADAMAFGMSGVNSPLTTDANGVVTATSTMRTAQTGFDQPFTNLAGSDYFSPTMAIKSASSSAPTHSHTNQAMNGFVGGLVEQRDSTGNFTSRAIGTNGALPTDIVIRTDPTSNRAEASVLIRQFDGASASANFRLGGISNVGRTGQSSFIDDQTYALRDRTQGTSTTAVMVGSITSTGSSVASRTVMASYGAAPVPNFFAGHGVTPCTCEFMTWGWWSGEVTYGSGSAYLPGARDRLNLATYVAGTLTTTVQLPTTGTATYTGHAVGNVLNGSNAYVAAGTYTNAWNFGTQTGAVAIGNFDGATYAGTASLVSGSVQFTGSIAGAGRTGSVNGAFFSSPTVAAKGQAGSFAITGPAYKAGGTFAAQKP